MNRRKSIKVAMILAGSLMLAVFMAASGFFVINAGAEETEKPLKLSV